MLTLHQKSLTESKIKNDNTSFQINQNLRSFNPSQFLNNLDQVHNIKTPQQNENTQQIPTLTEKAEGSYCRFPKLQSNSLLNISKPIDSMPQSKHNQLKSQLSTIFSQQNQISDNHIMLPGLRKQRKESQMFIQMIEQQISFPIQETQTSRQKRFQRKRDHQTQSQTNLDSLNSLYPDNSQLDDSNYNNKRVDFHKKVRVINLENGRIATEVIKEEDELKSPKQYKRKFVSQKTKYFYEDVNS
ncbi:unnamed protein product (macronuclear) [Paramecium tetraurelia]|uniref:Uncharacterized protein n=1 Tax=Paramecium tetraurelia TaxID=5888 RepID=A0D003_PARTE|nr:uncharacterized protein GSPATT00011944001 [Paramecium tetraurelia]CAK76370.1 unnamed protein product [Paramecium tetraurelia]|eukprot:XP_001443767.1 hypothetical protein (macronuclear) [Paramecium tetraurelia strain d4-2]